MKIELSSECDLAAFVRALGIEGLHVKIASVSPLNIPDAADNDFKVDEIDAEGIFVWPHYEDWEDDEYARCESEFIQWARIEEIYVY